jgi:tetratricopeptide (TPR) repeat protein
LQPSGNQVQLKGLNHQWQTWNNCGPATVTMNMSYFGRPETQVEAAQFLKPNRDDKNVSPEELAAYARTTGLQALVRRGGTIDQLKLLLSNNLPVLAETWLVHDGDGLGHYRLLIGYDDASGQFNTFDSLNGPDFKVTYAQFDADWRVFNRLYIVVYPPEQAASVAAIIGADMDNTAMDERILAEARAEAAAKPDDVIAYFNEGDALTRLGRFQEAAVAFDRARQLGLHWRRLWYQFTPFEAYYAAGRYQDVLDLTQATIKGAGGLEEAYYYRGLALQATGQAGAAQEFQAALDYNPNFAPAAEALNAASGGG